MSSDRTFGRSERNSAAAPSRPQDREGGRGAEAGRVRRLKDSPGARWTRSFVYGPERRRILETAAELLVPVT